MKPDNGLLEEEAGLVPGTPRVQIRATRKIAQLNVRKILRPVKETKIWSRMTRIVLSFWAGTDDVYWGVVLWG